MSSTDTDDPNRANPKTANALPSRPKLLIVTELPIHTPLRQDTEDPHRATPSTAHALASRAKDRRDRLLPKCKKSTTDIELPSRLKERNAKELPR
jgi:hypothetical protein